MINARQFKQLKEMGITLYQQREPHSHNTNTSDSISVDLSGIQHDAFFNDILSCISLSFGEVTIHPSSMDLGLFNWCFHDKSVIEYQNHVLMTPPLTQLKDSPSMKKALWHTIYKNLL